MSATPTVTQLQVESVVFPPTAKPPGSDKTLFLGGAGVRGMEIQGNFVKFTAIAVYMEGTAIPALAPKWGAKTVDELADSADFIREIIAGPFEKLTKVTMILPLTGQQYSEKVAENCTAYWKAVGKYTDAEGKAVEEFLQVFKDESFSPGASILFTQSPAGSLTIAFSKDGSIPEQGKAVIENKLLAEAILESIIGKQGVSPTARQSLAARVSKLLKQTSLAAEAQ
ncbi:chalcone--flavanone isomerase-like [Salvia miltiorrhiza]|uniref:chalcone--flavanone isomerase-like n=1 Tax=Salvia miltiorrhiza TaxID=226208 RepID=UPI0025ABA1C8|nr:chalcone--flavanone isomerase-like [Salvia miltiorrhiza]XP_057782388.1 chalcone--flavanone isomerase-like [Salvia miltiorrhiza]